MFDELTLHPRTRQLVEKLAGNLPHALVIDGPSGTGVTAVARAMARLAGSPEFVILPKKKFKNEFVVDMKEGSVIIEDIRSLYEQTRGKQPGRHVYVIDTGAKSMTAGAQNAFLKLLEEPRSGVHFIITTHHAGQLLPTVTSRSHRLTLLPVTEKQTADLIQSFGIDDATKRARLAFVGLGKPALIKRLANDEAAYNARAAIMSDAKLLLGNDVYKKLAVIHKYRENRADSLTLIDDMNRQLQTVINKQPDHSAGWQIVRDIEKHLETRRRISMGGNIRLQLAADVL